MTWYLKMAKGSISMLLEDVYHKSDRWLSPGEIMTTFEVSCGRSHHQQAPSVVAILLLWIVNTYSNSSGQQSKPPKRSRMPACDQGGREVR